MGPTFSKRIIQSFTLLAIRYPTCDQISCNDDSGIDRAFAFKYARGGLLVIIIEGYGGATGLIVFTSPRPSTGSETYQTPQNAGDLTLW